MSRTERGFGRAWAWSVFHRSMPPPARMIDIDTVEVCKYCKDPLFLGEVARDVGQSFKPTTIIRRLAIRANLPAFLILCKDEVIKEQVKRIRQGTQLMNVDDNEGNVPDLTENQLKVLWANLLSYDGQIIKLIQVYPQHVTERLTAKGFYDFICKTHGEHEASCPIRRQQLARILDIPIRVAHG